MEKHLDASLLRAVKNGKSRAEKYAGPGKRFRVSLNDVGWES